MANLAKSHYHAYIRSPQWRSKHPAWLKRSHNTCSMFPWMSVGKVKGKHHSYNMHHMHYGNLGNERLWLDVVPLSKFAHDFIIHGILSGFKRPSQQRSYPNTPQRIAHTWCRLPILFKWMVLWGAIACLGWMTLFG